MELVSLLVSKLVNWLLY